MEIRFSSARQDPCMFRTLLIPNDVSYPQWSFVFPVKFLIPSGVSYSQWSFVSPVKFPIPGEVSFLQRNFVTPRIFFQKLHSKTPSLDVSPIPNGVVKPGDLALTSRYPANLLTGASFVKGMLLFPSKVLIPCDYLRDSSFGCIPREYLSSKRSSIELYLPG